MDRTGPPNTAGGTGARHAFEEHTSELQVRLEAPTLAELFAEAGRALAEVMSADTPLAPSPSTPLATGVAKPGRAVVPSLAEGATELGPYESVRLHAADRSALLVDWLNELLFRTETARRIFTDFRVDRISDQELSASIRGPQVELEQTPVKAATMHNIAIREELGRFRATVVLDV